MHECFKAKLILQTSVNTRDPSEEQNHKWDPALSLSYQFHCQQMLLASSWLPGAYWQVWCCKASVKEGNVKSVKGFVLAFACLSS